MKRNIYKSATLTFHYVENYGAVLQAFALQYKIKELGHENVILNYKSKSLTNSFSLNALKVKGIVRYILGICYWIVRRLRKPKFDKFRSSMNITSPISKHNLTKLYYDKYIVGSDQVWNHNLVNEDQTYMLKFVRQKDKKASYAASFGFEKLDDDKKDIYRKMLQDFNYINVRESSALNIVKDLVDKKVSLTLDPTFLLTKECWKKLSEERLINEKYLFTYQVTSSRNLVKYTKNIKKYYRKKIVSVPFPIGGIMLAKIDMTAGPREWLSYLQYCEMLITDSFHGVALSIIFNVPFKVILEGVPARITNLLKLFDLQNHIVRDTNDINLEQNYNWRKVNDKISYYRENSILNLEDIFKIDI